MKKAYGFTIVELLVAIVVVAILAAISIVACTNGGSEAGQSDSFPGFVFSPTRASYGAVIYCTDESVREFRIMARSKSGRFLSILRQVVW